MSAAEAADAALVVPKVDAFKYRFIELDNQLKALLVSDPTADKCAASLDVSEALGDA